MGLCLRDPTDPGAWVASMADFTHLYTDRSGSVHLAWRGGPCASQGAREDAGTCFQRARPSRANACSWTLDNREQSPCLPCLCYIFPMQARRPAVCMRDHPQHEPLPFSGCIFPCRPEDLQYACVTILNMNPDSPSRQVRCMF